MRAGCEVVRLVDMRVLVVEDDPNLRGAVDRRLRAEGLAVDAVADIPEARVQLSAADYDCLVLDRMVPSGDTLSLLVELRGDGRDTPVLFLTARDAVSDRVAGFEAGGDDYLVKPFSMAELVARVRSLCRRSGEVRPSVLRVADLEVDSARREVRRDGVLIPLRQREFAVLERMAIGAGRVVTRTELIEHCWDELTDPMSNVVDVHMASLRRKLGGPPLIRTVRGAGYLMEEATGSTNGTGS
jgi:DNA-binding response OmpR family regulator